MGVNHHRNIDIVEMPLLDQFTLTAEQREFPRLHQIPSELDLDILLGRHRKEHDVPCHLLRCLRINDRHHRPHQPGDLRIVPTGVCRARLGVHHWMIGHAQRIQFADQGHGWPGPLPLQGRFHARPCQTGFRREPELFHRIGHELRRPILFKAKFRIGHDMVANPFDLAPSPIDRLEYLLF